MSNELFFFCCQQHYFEVKPGGDPRYLPSHKCNFEGSARRILHSKNKLHTKGRVQKRVNITVKAFLFARKMFFMYNFYIFVKLNENSPIDAAQNDEKVQSSFLLGK